MGSCHFNPPVQASVLPPAPPTSGRVKITSISDPAKALAMDQELSILLAKGAIEPKQIHEGHTLPHADHSRCPTNCGARGMVRIHRPQGRLLPRPHRSATSAVSALCLSGRPLAVQGATLWALPLPKGVHEVCGRSPCSATVSRLEGSPIPGRLADLCIIPGPGVQRYSASPGPPRTQGEYGEELPGTISGHNLHWGGVAKCNYDSQTLHPPRGRHPAPSWPIPRGPSVDLCHISSSLGQTNVHFSCGSSGLAVAAPPAEVAEWLPLGCQAAQVQEAQGVTTVSPRLGLHAQGCPYGLCSLSQGDCHHRCLPLRMGGSMAEQDGPWAVVCGRPGCTHQRAGAASSSPGSQALPATPEGQACPRKVRQHIHCVSHKSSGRDQVSAAAGSGRRAPHVGSPPPDQPSGNVSTGRAKSSGRLPLPSETSIRRVAPPPGGGEHHLEPLWQSGGGSLRFRGVDPLSSVVLLGRDDQSSRPGRTGSSLAGRPSVCLSSASSDSAGTPKGPSGGSQDPACGSLLAREELVPTAARTLSRCTVVPSQQEGSPVPAGGGNLAPRSTTPPTVCLAAGGPEPLLSSCADPVRRTIMNARAPSHSSPV